MTRPGHGRAKSRPDPGDAVSFAFPAAPDKVRHGLVCAVDTDGFAVIDTGAPWTVLVAVAWVRSINFAPVP
jgi:hypothetical protein